MRYSAHISFRDLALAPVGQIGGWGEELARLIKTGIPVSAGFVIPARTLWLIAEANQLASQLQHSKNLASTRRIFTGLHFPSAIAEDLLRAIHTQLFDQKTQVTASWLSKTGPRPHLSETAIGDATIMETILEIWGEAYCQQPPGQSTLVPISLVLQVNLESNLIGHTYTRDQTADKHTIALHVTQHSTPIVIDIRTWNVIAGRHLAMFQQAPEDAWLRLARHLQTIRLSSLHNYRVHWQIYNQQPLINHLTQIDPPAVLVPRSVGSFSQIAVSGRPAITGKVRGKVTTQLSQITPQSVLVVHQLETLSTAVCQLVAAVVVDTHISRSVLAQLQHYHVPVIVNARDASSRFKPGQPVLVDATKGLITVLQTSPTTFPPRLSNKLYISVNQGLNDETPPASQVQGIMFRPEMTLASQGIHPLHLIRSRQREQLFRHLLSSLSSYRPLNLPMLYRTSTFTSDQLRDLQHGHMYEPNELNPRLGFFGGLRHVTSSELFEFELAAVTRIAPTFSQPPGLVLGGCRTISELKYLTHRVLVTTSSYRHRIWWELTTPEQLFTLTTEQLQQTHGIVINGHMLHSLSLGIDPSNQDVYHRYAWNQPLMDEWLGRVKAIAGDKPVFLYMMEDQPDIFRLVKTKQLTGLVVKSVYAQVASSYLETHV